MQKKWFLQDKMEHKASALEIVTSDLAATSAAMTTQDPARAIAGGAPELVSPMPSSPKISPALDLDLSLAQRLAWLLRADVRKGKGSSESLDEAFAQWWLIQGRSEYPYWSYLSDAQKLALFEPAGKMAVGTLEQVVPKAMQLVLARRPDVMQKFSVDKNVNVAAVAGWFWIMGLIEHAMSKAVALDQIRALDRPVLVDPSLDPNPTIETPSPTVLMRMAWHLMSAEMQAQMDLNLSESRYRYLCWFFVVARPLFKFEAIIANRWKSWLLQNLPVSTANPADATLGELPRFALMEYALMDAKTKPPLKTPSDVEKLRAWSQEQTKANQKWAWLKQKIAYQDNGLPIDTAPIWRPAEALAAAADAANVTKDGVTAAAVTATAATAATATAGAVVPTKTKVKRPMGLNLFGFALGELGLGEDLRMAVEVCKAAKIPYRVINISPGSDTGQADLALADELAKGPVSLPYAINVFCMPGFDVANRIFLRYGAKPFEGFYNIGWWPWELDVWPKAWQVGFALADEIWSCSEFSDAMYRKSINKPVTAMPLAASVARTQTHSRAHYGLPAKAYLYLYVFDFNSHVVRKNPQAAIDAFWLAFGKVPSKAHPKTAVGLVLKVMNTKPKDPAWLAFEKAIATDSRIHLISKTLARPEVLGLIESCDAYVSPHRAEGFGRTLAEAMLLGKPVIATNYSGNQFFMNPEVTLPVDYTLEEVKTGDYHFIESADGARWAKPDIAHMAKRMQEAYDHRADKALIAKTKHYAQSVFAPERTAMIMWQRLEQLVAELQARGLLATK